MDNKDRLLIKVDKDGRIRDEMGYGKLLWNHWNKSLKLDFGAVGYLTFTPCDPKEFKEHQEG